MLLRVDEDETAGVAGLETFLLATVPVAISAGGALGAAAIQADAVKYAAAQQRKASVIESISTLKALTKQAEAEVEIAKTAAKTTTQGLSTGAKAGLAALALFLLLK